MRRFGHFAHSGSNTPDPRVIVAAGDHVLPRAATGVGRLAIVVGIDGAGKSSAIRGLHGFETSHWRQLASTSVEWANRIDNASRIVDDLRGPERTRFILTLLEGEWKQCIQPRVAAGHDVVCDGFFLRPLVKETIFGDGDIESVIQSSPLSGDELVVLVDVPVDVAVNRKRGQKISAYECFHSADDFLQFQTAQKETLQSILKGWRHVVVDGTQPPGLVTADLERALVSDGIQPSFRTGAAAPGRVNAGA